jgi:hypothetical protein
VNILRDIGYGGVVLNVTRDRITSLTLTARDINSLSSEAGQ